MAAPLGGHDRAATPHVIYLHGFASSPASSKAALFRERFTARGFGLHCPDLNQPDFSTLTTSRMIAQVASMVASLPQGPVVLVGSSLGAFVALHVAERAPSGPHPIERLVLLAPALDFGRRPVGGLGPDGMARWRAEGWWELTHHASGKRCRVHYELFRDAQDYDSFSVRRTTPTLVLQGRRDVVVDPDMVARFASARPHVTLIMMDDDHRLTAEPEALWSETARFLGLTDPEPDAGIDCHPGAPGHRRA